MYIIDDFSQGIYRRNEYFYTKKTNTYKDIEQFLSDDKELFQKFKEEKKPYSRKNWKDVKREISLKYFKLYLAAHDK